MTDAEVLELVQHGEVLGDGIGGTRSLVVLDEVPVFVKRVPLTDLEMLPGNVGSTANLFDLPMECQYGVGSPSFGVWREVAANTMATSWVTSGSCPSFPLLHHWRSLSLAAFDGPLPDELGDIDTLVAHWHDSTAVRRRAEAIAESSASVAMFFEYIPELLPNALSRRLVAGELTDRSIDSIHRDLLGATTMMNSAGLLHFDTHFGNILCAGQKLYVTDFGLATSTSFDLAPDEVGFIHANTTHDVAYVTTRLVDWLVTNLGGISDRQSRDEAISNIAAGAPAEHVIPDAGSAMVARFAGVATIINRFYEQLHGRDRTTPYPSTAVEAAWVSAATPFDS